MATGYDYPLLISHLLHSPVANAPGREIVHAGVIRYGYGTLQERVCRLAGALVALGVGQGSVVAVMDWDSHRYFESFFAVPMLGATLHTVNIRLSPEQILYTINHAEDDVILVHRDFVPVLAGILGRITRPVRFVLMQDMAAAEPEGLHFSGEYEALLAHAPASFPFADFDEGTRATLFYTTGTTGDPKGVSYTHRQLVLHTLALSADLGSVPDGGGFHRGDVYMPITPLFHVHGWGFPYVATFLGVKQVYPGRYEAAKLLRLIGEEGVTFSHCVPTILNMLLTAPESTAADLSRWKVLIGGSALPQGLAKAAVGRGINVHAAYGLSETCPFLSHADMIATQGAGDGIALRTAAGKPAPLVSLRVVDAEMRDIPRDGRTTGEIVARAPWLTAGYLKNPAGTEALWRGGYMHTGDVGYFDEAGDLRITDRIKDVIKSGGEWISSLALENLASRCQGVVEAAAIAIPDPKWGERPMLALVLREGTHTPAVEAEVRDAIAADIAAGRLSRWALPERVVVVAALPKTSVGKLDKKALRLQFSGQ